MEAMKQWDQCCKIVLVKTLQWLFLFLFLFNLSQSYKYFRNECCKGSAFRADRTRQNKCNVLVFLRNMPADTWGSCLIKTPAKTSKAPNDPELEVNHLPGSCCISRLHSLDDTRNKFNLFRTRLGILFCLSFPLTNKFCLQIQLVYWSVVANNQCH